MEQLAMMEEETGEIGQRQEQSRFPYDVVIAEGAYRRQEAAEGEGGVELALQMNEPPVPVPSIIGRSGTTTR